MILEKNNDYLSYEKKIIPYLDGSLSKEDTSEFEAFVLTHPEFEEKIKTRQLEIQNLKQMIPVALISQEALESIQGEMRTSVFNLLKEDPKGLFDNFRIRWEEWRNR